MSTDAETAKERKPAASSAPPGPRKKKVAAKRRKLMRPLSEEEINVPDLQTLIMLGALAGLAIVLWIFAHAGCNYHPPRETRRSRDVTTADLTREPKDAAIEFQQRFLTYNYKGAAEIAAGPLSDVVAKERAACDADKAGCAARKKALGDIITSATVLERGPLSSRVRVTTHRLPGGNKTFLVLAERGVGGWKVTAHVPDQKGAELPAPVLNKGAPRPVPDSEPGTGAPAGSPLPAGHPPLGSALPAGHPKVPSARPALGAAPPPLAPAGSPARPPVGAQPTGSATKAP
jgi:hypothetical protein